MYYNYLVQQLWLRSNVVASHPAGPGSFPSQIHTSKIVLDTSVLSAVARKA